MRVVLQRVSSATVTVGGDRVASIEKGLLLLVGVAEGDEEADVEAAVDKIVDLRVFPDDEGKMNRSIRDVGGGMLVVSQFTLLGDVRKGRRPSFTGAARPEEAAPLIDQMLERFQEAGVPVDQGEFGASMQVALVNDGPVTLVIDVRGGRVL